MPEQITVGELTARFLEACGVDTAFGVISIHNMPILDAFGRRNAIRFVPSRGEAGAVNMADAFARVRGHLGVAVTSTGTAAGNAAGAMVEARTAGTPLLHITGQIELPYLDRGWSYIHEAHDQPGMLKAVSKAFFRVWSPDSALGVLQEAVRCALTAPTGPVSVEIPIDVQEALVPLPASLAPLPVVAAAPSAAALDELADRLATAKRPLIWLGGGARHAGEEVRALADLGFIVVTSVQGRGILPEQDERSLGAFNVSAPVEDFYKSCDALLVVGSRLRGNETLKYNLKLPRPLYQIDADPQAHGRGYTADYFVAGDAKLALAGLVARLSGRSKIDPRFAADARNARAAAEKQLRDSLGPYDALVAALQKAVPSDFVWVRDVTVSNSTWGNRLLKIDGPRNGVHALGGGIGMGAAMGVGAALAANGRKTVALSGDGGLMLNLGELATAVQENADLMLIVMNDNGYGVIRNIQDAKFGGRHYYADLHTPSFSDLAKALGWKHYSLSNIADAEALVAKVAAEAGPRMLEVDMTAIGPFASAFAGPPVRKAS
ncbi:thiamine pyrophosphate-binding protein [uncultured Ferrovibrio sp.]|jgi:acetolactate synthase-1/2/3 large subunit|uniref:thiamine pyrophosphate-binding protein n=1 Tax=uncultured Ferrovibrio sp. TaxID=1576913 RepID=UPI002633FBCB|nr:thiamine pyrophosphate-binding protein [uncultured Ferrovibrio sp.]